MAKHQANRRSRVKHMKNQTAPVPDMTHSFHLKKTQLHRWVAQQMEKLVIDKDHLSWLTQGRAVLVIKNLTLAQLPATKNLYEHHMEAVIFYSCRQNSGTYEQVHGHGLKRKWWWQLGGKQKATHKPGNHQQLNKQVHKLGNSLN